MKSFIYIIIVCGCAWILIEPKEVYKAPELPNVELKTNKEQAIYSTQIDTLITNIEKNIKYLKHAKITEN